MTGHSVVAKMVGKEEKGRCVKRVMTLAWDSQVPKSLWWAAWDGRQQMA